MARRWLRMGAALLVALLVAYAGLSLLLPPARPVADALAQEGRDVTDADLSGALASRLAAQTPAAIVLVEPAPLGLDEGARLADYVDQGGDLWILASDPTQALWSAAKDGVRTLPGVIYSSNTSAPALDLAGVGVVQPGAHALDIRAPWTPRVGAGTESFRDIDGDGRVSTGEPAGPFVVGASLRVGRGTLTVIALQAADEAPTPQLVSAISKQMAPGAVLVQDAPPHAAWASPGRAMERGVALLGAGGLLADSLVALAAAAGLVLVILIAARPSPEALARARAEGHARAWLEALRARRPDYHTRLSAQSELPPGEK